MFRTPFLAWPVFTLIVVAGTLAADDKDKGKHNPGGSGPNFSTIPGRKPPGNAPAEPPKPRNAVRQGEGLPHPHYEPDSNAAKVLKERGVIREDHHINPPGGGGPVLNSPNLGTGAIGRVNVNPPGTGIVGGGAAQTLRIHPSQPVPQARIDKNGVIGDVHKHPQFAEDFNRIKTTRNPEEINRFFTKLQTDPALKNTSFGAVNVHHLSGNFQNAVVQGGYPHLIQSNVGTNLHLAHQYHLYAGGGDVARQLHLDRNLVALGGWQGRYVGTVYPRYTTAAFSAWYPGPAFYPRYVWMPVWSPWVSWSWWNYVWPIYDPRPFIVRPIVYAPALPITVFDYPAFAPLPVVTCGTWVDVPPVTVDAGVDLQLLAVRFVDPGYVSQDLGPRYRVWVRNNSPAAVATPVDVTLVAANTETLPSPDSVQAGAVIPSINPGETVPVDIRLPAAANQLAQSPEGRRVPFGYLHIIVDSHRAANDVNPANNGAILARGDILPVDPAAFSPDVTATTPGSMVTVAGEGFGPEPGQVVVMVEGVPQQAEIYGWYDLGVNFKLPAVIVNGATEAQVVVVRGDGAASNPVTLTVAQQQQITQVPLPPAPNP